jgi:molybdate transport system permease protein
MKDRLGRALFVALAAVTLVFLVLPIVAIFVHTTPGKLIGQLSNPVVTDAFIVTLKTSLVAQALIVFFGTPTAYLLATRRFVGRSAAITLVELPLVLPPAVAGIGLIFALGRYGLLGSKLDTLGINVGIGTQAAVVIAVAYVASPLYVRHAIAAFEAVDPRLPAASRTLGAGSVRTFFRIMLPLARGGLYAGLALSFARGLGEFGATIMFAGSPQGVTQTLSLAIYSEFNVNQDTALAIGGALVIISAVVLFTLRIALSWQRSSSNASPSLFGLSSSR